MSTKTTFKRIALVAVAALGLSVLSVAPSTAAADSTTLGATASDATTAVAVTNTVTVSAISGTAVETITATVVLLSAPATSTSADVLPVITFGATQPTGSTNTDSSTVGSVINVASKGAGRYASTATISVKPDVAGVYVYRITPGGAANNTTAQTWTVTAVAPTVKSIKAFLNTDSSTALTADATTLSYPAASSVTTRGALTVQQYSTTDTTTVATTAISQAVTVTIDKGLVSATNDYFTGVKSVSTAAAAAANVNAVSRTGLSTYYVFSNGEVGTATLTVTVGALTSTKTITFQGVATTLSAALATSAATWIAPNGTTTVNVTAKDSAGNAAVALPTTMTATPASTAIATAAFTSAGVVTITGVAAGTTVITIADSATTAPAASATYTVTVAPTLSATLPTLAFDKTEYAAGELMTITVSAAAADNASFAAFTSTGLAYSVNVATVKTPFTSAVVALVGGKATMTAYAPITAGPVTITAMSGAGVVSTVTSAEVKATTTVVSDGVAQAAVDAAAEAKDAADAATDAANTAAEAADAATAAAQDAADAVAALATSVEAMITALKKQITALTNLVIKIQKKVKA